MHNLNVYNGQSSYIGRQSAWHKLGLVKGTFFTYEEIQAQGFTNFLPVKQALHDKNGRELAAWGVFRPDTDAFLGPVGSDYTVIDHSQGFRMLDALMGQQNGAHYETAGVLGEGEVVWGLANLNFSIKVGTSGDGMDVYLLFVTSHNGTISHVYRMTCTRVVCQNTLQIALSSKAASFFRVRHTKNAQVRLDAAHDALADVANDAKTVEEKLNMLATRKVTREAMTTVLDRLFPASKDDKGEKIDSTRRKNILSDVLGCYERNDGNTFPEQRGTAYNLLNAVIEYTDHMRSGKDRAESAMFGSGDRLKTQAIEVIMQTANGLPVIETRPQIFTPAPKSLLDSVVSDTKF